MNTPCKLFTGAQNNRGYGQVRREGKTHLAHRVAFAEAHGIELSALRGLVIRHRCDTPLCVNPEHLEPGSQRQNIHDAIERGRAKKPPVMRGSGVGTSKLKETDIPTIRARLAAGEFQRVIAADYGVSQVQISHIARRIQWGHV
ncbi:HNH endonuclease [Burkholderia gladioli]|uniref:HNH endonuclease n=1 Tax=Burkholderia gladioli TaxID=28095 RepID=UPI001641AA09|nr:HNH endonuclease [Burkholderia gladioli]